jgi:glutathione peroxidase-family protein
MTDKVLIQEFAENAYELWFRTCEYVDAPNWAKQTLYRNLKEAVLKFNCFALSDRNIEFQKFLGDSHE